MTTTGLTSEQEPMGDHGLGRRSWTWAQGVPLLAAVLTVAGVFVTVAATPQVPPGTGLLLVAGVLALGAVIFAVGRAVAGAPAVHRRVARARRAWASAHRWTYTGDAPAAPPAMVDLVLPRGWNFPVLLATMHGVIHQRTAWVQTWSLRSGITSKRQNTHREVVAVSARTGDYRMAVVTVLPLDPALITPSWVKFGSRSRKAAPGLHLDGDPEVLQTWGPAVTAAVQAHEDLPLAVVVGADQVVVYALDDPRPATTTSRLEVAAAVAAIVDPAPRHAG